VQLPEVGAWQRVGISIEGGPLHEDEHVVWLQAGPYYADSRGFAGTTSSEADRVRWEHEVGVPGDDEGLLRRDDDLLVETGTTPSGGTYVEHWLPLTGAQEPSGAWVAGSGRVVRVGEHVVHVDGTGGIHLTLP